MNGGSKINEKLKEELYTSRLPKNIICSVHDSFLAVSGVSFKYIFLEQYLLILLEFQQ